MTLAGILCDPHSIYLLSDMPPPLGPPPHADFALFKSHTHFKLADLLFHRIEASASQINELMQLLAALAANGQPPFMDQQHMLDVINSIAIGGWERYKKASQFD